MNTNTDGVSAMSAELGLLNEWADASCTSFVCRSHGLQTTATVSHEDLIQLVRVAFQIERKRWEDIARQVVASHDAALAYVYEQMQKNGTESITIPDAAVAEIKAVNALRSLLPNQTAKRRSASA